MLSEIVRTDAPSSEMMCCDDEDDFGTSKPRENVEHVLQTFTSIGCRDVGGQLEGSEKRLARKRIRRTKTGRNCLEEGSTDHGDGN